MSVISPPWTFPHVFSFRHNRIKEAKHPRLRSLFSTHCGQKNLPWGAAQVKSGEERTSELDGGMKQQIRGSWMSSTLHTTCSHRRLKEAGAEDARTPAKSLASKGRPSERRLAGWWELHISFDYSKKKRQGFLLSSLSQLSACRKISTWQSPVELSASCVFVYVFDWNGARKKAKQISVSLFFSYVEIQVHCVCSPRNFRAQHKL